MTTTPTTIKAALALLTGAGSLTDPKLGCLGDGDLAAIQTILAAFKAQRAALRRIRKDALRAAEVAATLDGFNFDDTPRVLTDDDAGDLSATADTLAADLQAIAAVATLRK